MNQPMFNAPRIITIAIFVFSAIHSGLYFAGREVENEALLYFAFLPQRFDVVGDELAISPFFKVLSFVSYSFLHANFTHLIMNMAWFLVFGVPLARRWSNSNLLIFWVVCSIAGAALFWAFHYNDVAVMIGASGAISGLMGAGMRFMYSGTALTLPQMFTSKVIMINLCFWLVFNVLFGIIVGGIAWEAHLGGFLAGLLLFPYFDRIKT